ncbi:MAG: PCYCGC motif-containing (lipo)protein, partial [Candidatus Hydrothermarchaeaceae archaeon]
PLPVSLPDYAKRSKGIEASYIIATQIPEVLEKIPCYCGCGSAGHKSLRHCFINDDGTFGEHASYCDLCMSESYEVYEWYNDGVPLKEVRKRIDDKYGARYGKGTETPPV